MFSKHAAPKHHTKHKTVKPHPALQGLKNASTSGPVEEVMALSSPPSVKVTPPAVATPPTPSKPHTFNGQVATSSKAAAPVAGVSAIDSGPKSKPFGGKQAPPFQKAGK